MMYEFISGPMVWIAFGLFFAGLVIQGFRFFQLTSEKQRHFLPAPPKKKKKKGKQADKKKSKPVVQGDPLKRMILTIERWLEPLTRYAARSYRNLRYSMVGQHPVMTAVTVVFHVFLFITPLFLLAHNELLRESRLGFGLPSLSESTTDLMTIIYLISALVFLFRRIFVRRVRAITAPTDYFVWLVAVAPFLTGFLAYHQWFDYRLMLTAHIIAGEAMLILTPHTKLGHMIYFFLYRFFLGGEYGFGQGRRAW